MWKTQRYNFRDRSYSFIPSMGWMRSNTVAPSRAFVCEIHIPDIPEKCCDNLRCVNHPYNVCGQMPCKDEPAVKWHIKLYGRLLIWLSLHFYPLLYLFSYLRLNVYEDGTVSSEVFSKIHPADQHILCLSRSVFIATTSRRFKSHGTMFVGAMLPSRSLHAWVMEDGCNVCKGDVYWTNYTPLAIMY